MGLPKLQSFCLTKEIISNVKKQPREQDKESVHCVSDGVLIPRKHKEQKFNNKAASIQLSR